MLDPAIKEVTDRLFRSNPVRFSRLVIWIKRSQNQGWSDPVIAQTLIEFESWDKQNNFPDWWKPLTGLLPKVCPRVNQTESSHFKKLDPSESWKKLLSAFTDWTSKNGSAIDSSGFDPILPETRRGQVRTDSKSANRERGPETEAAAMHKTSSRDKVVERRSAIKKRMQPS